MSLPQRGYTTGYDPARDDRTPYQLERFGRGLKGINVWYGSQFTTTLVCDWAMPEAAENAAPIDKRGNTRQADGFNGLCLPPLSRPFVLCAPLCPPRLKACVGGLDAPLSLSLLFARRLVHL